MARAYPFRCLRDAQRLPRSGILACPYWVGGSWPARHRAGLLRLSLPRAGAPPFPNTGPSRSAHQDRPIFHAPRRYAIFMAFLVLPSSPSSHTTSCSARPRAPHESPRHARLSGRHMPLRVWSAYTVHCPPFPRRAASGPCRGMKGDGPEVGAPAVPPGQRHHSAGTQPSAPEGVGRRLASPGSLSVAHPSAPKPVLVWRDRATPAPCQRRNGVGRSGRPSRPASPLGPGRRPLVRASGYS